MRRASVRASYNTAPCHAGCALEALTGRLREPPQASPGRTAWGPPPWRPSLARRRTASPRCRGTAPRSPSPGCTGWRRGHGGLQPECMGLQSRRSDLKLLDVIGRKQLGHPVKAHEAQVPLGVVHARVGAGGDHPDVARIVLLVGGGARLQLVDERARPRAVGEHRLLWRVGDAGLAGFARFAEHLSNS